MEELYLRRIRGDTVKKIIVYFLQNGTSKIYDSMEELTADIPSVTAKRVLYCIRTGIKWRTMVFDEVIDDSGRGGKKK